MRIVIIGDGKVGYKLAKQLSEEEYDIVMIDSNARKMKEAGNKLDVFCVTGEAASVEVQREGKVPHADLVIACTSMDETNMLSCLVAKRLGAKHTIARVRNPIYYQQIDMLKEDLRLSMAVNPELTVAKEITRVLIYPDASKIETFVKGRVELIEFPLTEQNPMTGMALKDLYTKYQIQLLVCAVERGKDVIIPDGEYVLRPGDRLHVAASHKEVKQFMKLFGQRKNKIKKVLICGGGRVSYYLTQGLAALGMQVKIIEKNRERCEELCELLPKATIICGDATDHDLLYEEGMKDADAFVALTGLDEENIIMSLLANSHGIPKIVAKVNGDWRVQMVEDLGIDSVVSAKSATADAILSYVRARQNSLSSANVETMYQLVNGRIEALEFIIHSKTSYTDIPLKDLPTKPNNLIACIARKRQIIIPNGNDCIRAGDSLSERGKPFAE